MPLYTRALHAFIYNSLVCLHIEAFFDLFILQDYYNQLFGIKTINSNSISQALCLPVSVSELVEVNLSSKVCSLLSF